MRDNEIMITSPFTIILTDIEQAGLTKLTCSARAETSAVLRARIVLAAARRPATPRSQSRPGCMSTPFASGVDGSSRDGCQG